MTTSGTGWTSGWLVGWIDFNQDGTFQSNEMVANQAINNNVTKVPLLGDIPILGYVFKQTGKELDKTELLIFLTPRIIKESVTAVR